MVTPGTAFADTLDLWLGRAADFILSLKDADGRRVPGLFRASVVVCVGTENIDVFIAGIALGIIVEISHAVGRMTLRASSTVCRSTTYVPEWPRRTPVAASMP
mgnify:CR=1 FL=1